MFKIVSENITRFLILCKRICTEQSGDDKSTIMFTTKHETGALVDVLAAFPRSMALTLSHIDKRPSGRVNWNYTFYIDADAHQDTPPN